MRYLMKQKMWAFGDDFIIRDDSGNDAYLVDGKAFSFGHKLSFQDMSGQELAYIAQKNFSFKTRYEIFHNDELFAEVVKDFTFFKDQFTVDIPGPNDYEVQGDFWDYEYAFIRNGETVAQVSKAFFSLTDTYGIEIADSEDAVTILATAVVIDLVKQDEKDR